MGNNILIVDDAMFMRRIIREILEENGFSDICEADNGIDAVNQYQKNNPDLIFLDITMPGKSGLEVLKEILQAAPDAKVVMCSSIGQEETVQNALKNGAVEFVVKPFRRDKIVEIAGKYLR